MATSIEELAARVKAALESGNLDGYQDLLAPGVHWGPPDQPEWGCHDRSEVLTWYKAARDRGMHAEVNELIPGADCILVGLTVWAEATAAEAEPTPRWQVLTLDNGLIIDICGFDDRSQALRAGIAD